MKSELLENDASPQAPGPSRRIKLGALILVAGLGVAACNSDPSARRVAEDIINTLADPGAVRDCMLDKLDEYSDDELDEITASANDPGPGTAIDRFEADLAECN